MIAELRKRLNHVGTINNLNDHQVENLAAILFILHYKLPVPEFEDKEAYMKELGGVAPLKVSLKTAREERDVSLTKWFHKENIIV